MSTTDLLDGELRAMFAMYRRGGAWEDQMRGPKFDEWCRETEERIVAFVRERATLASPVLEHPQDYITPPFTIGSWPPPRGTVVLHLMKQDAVYGQEITPAEARELARELWFRAMSAEGDDDWWKHRESFIEAATAAQPVPLQHEGTEQ